MRVPKSRRLPTPASGCTLNISLKVHLYSRQVRKEILFVLQAIETVFKTETDNAGGEDEVWKTDTRRFGLSEFESFVDYRTRNDSSNLINTLNMVVVGRGVQLQLPIVNDGFWIRI